MLDSARLERALVAAARRYAPTLIPPGQIHPGDVGDLSDLARRLADEGALVLAAQTDAPDPAAVYKAWGEAYTALHTRLCEALFPSFGGVSAVYIDQADPPIAALSGMCAPALGAIGAYIAPYAAARVGVRPSDIEVRGVIEMLLDALEAGDLARDEYARLREDCAALLRRLLDLPIRSFAVTPPARAIVGAIGTTPVALAPPAPPPTTIPEPAAAPAPPPGLPETARPVQPAFRADAVPIFFDPARRPDDAMPPPPVPGLPGDLPK
ncbi:MAG: hypothetical protein SGJ24_01990 [Chloroflexota bacterium]|nr:hypothetical protein [Chloroflexota bacterium]